VAKAYGAGADFNMLGGMLAGHDECDGEIHYEERDGEKVPVGMTFYGMSSETAMKKHSGGVAHYRAAEGKSVETPYRGPVDGTMGEIMGGVRSMMTYIGAAHLKEVPKRTTFVRVSAQTNDVFGGGGCCSPAPNNLPLVGGAPACYKPAHDRRRPESRGQRACAPRRRDARANPGRPRRDRNAGARAQDAHRAAVALDLSSRRARVLGDAQYREASGRPADRTLHTRAA